jgi:hypothetical protein
MPSLPRQVDGEKQKEEGGEKKSDKGNKTVKIK